MADLATQLRVAVRSAPVADSPGVAYGAAQQPQPDQAAQAAASFRWAYQSVQTLHGLHPEDQIKAWGAYNKDEQNLLSGIGYQPPTPDRGFFGGLWHTITHPVSSVLNPALSDLGAPLRFVQHGYRTLHELDLRGFTSAFHASQWSDAWTKTKDGEKYVPHMDKILGNSGLDPTLQPLAQDFATGHTLEDLIGKYGPDLTAQAVNDPKWADTLDAINRGRFSPGRQLASGLGLKGRVGTLLSGATDAAFDVFSDPVQVALTGASEAYKAKYLIKGPQDVERLWGSAGVQRAVSRISEQLGEGGRGIAGVTAEFPNLRPIAEDLAKTAGDPNAIKDVFKLHAGLDAGINGQGVGFFKDMPRLGPLGPAKLATRLRVNDALDWFSRSRALPEAGTPGRNTLTGAARFLKGMMTRFEKTGGIDLADPSSEKFFRQVADLAIPRQDYVVDGVTKAGRDTYYNAYVAGDLGTRHDVYLSMLHDTFHALGSDWEEGLVPQTRFEEYHKAVVGAAQGSLERPYGIGMDGAPNSAVDTLTGSKSFAVRESQFTTSRAIPDVLKMANAARAERLFGDLGQESVQRFMKVWKGAMLMRFGFPLRVGGEEAFRFLLDNGLMPYIKAKAAKFAVKGEEYRAKALAAEFGVPEDDRVITGIQQTISHTANRALYAASKAGEAIAGEWYTRAAGVLTQHLGADVLPEGIGAGHIVQNYENSAPGLVETIRDVKTGKLARFRMKPQGWTADIPNAEAWQNQLARIVKDPSTKAALEHAGNLDEATRAVEDLMRSDAWASYRSKSGMLEALKQKGLTEDQAISELARRNAEDTFSLTHSPDGTPHEFVTGAPPVPDGYVRLYRGKGANMTPLGEPDEVTKLIDPRGVANMRSEAQKHAAIAGRWFTTDIEKARGFGSVSYVDVPQDVAISSKQAALKVNEDIDMARAKAMGLHFDNEHILPAELVSKARPYGGGSYLKGAIPDVSQLDQVPLASRPMRVATEKLIPVPLNKAQLLSDWFFRLSDRWINTISREPFYTHELAKSLAQIEPEVQRLGGSIGEQQARKIGEDWAMRRAYENVKPFIHNPELRNVFEQYHQATMPFWFAKEQFYRRWSKTLMTNPAVARRAQLLMMGLRHSGIVHTDDQGQDYFYIPTLPFMGQALAKVAGLVTGVNASFPIDVPMTAQVKFLSAASEGPQVGFGPFVGLSLGALSRRFPELFGQSTQDIQQGLLGERATGKPLWQNFTPTIVNNTYNAAMAKESESAQVGSAISHTILQLHAQGLDPGPNATPEQQQIFLHRVSVWTRSMLGLRAMLGFVSPSTPQFDIPADNIRPELIKLMNELPLEQALGTFMKLHPDKGYLAVFATQTVPGGQKPMSVSEQAGKWLADNRGFISKYGAAAASYFLPDAPEGFDQATWQQELAIGMRQRKTGQQYWTDLQIASDKNYYYDAQARYYQLRANLTGSARTDLDQRWAQLKQTFLASRPMLADFINQGGDRADARNTVLSALERAYADNKIPDPQVQYLIGGYQQYFQAAQALAGRRDAQATDLRRQYTAMMLQWATRFNGAAASIYNQLILPDLPKYEGLNG